MALDSAISDTLAFETGKPGPWKECAMELDSPLDRLLETGGHVRVLRALTHVPRGFPASGREIARRAGVSHTTASRVLGALDELRVVHLQRAGRADLYTLHDEHVLVAQIRALFAHEGGIRTELVEFLRRELPRRIGGAEGAFLFGSAARGETHRGSDIDVGLLSPERSATEIEPALAALAVAVRDRFGSELNVLIAPTGRRGRRPMLWDRIKADGIPLLGPRVHGA